MLTVPCKPTWNRVIYIIFNRHSEVNVQIMQVPNPAIVTYGGIWYFAFLLVVKNREADVVVKMETERVS